MFCNKSVSFFYATLNSFIKNEKILEKEKEDTVLNKSVLKLAADMYCNDADPEYG